MFKVQIENLNDGRKWGGKFPTELKAQDWLEQQLRKSGRNVDKLWFREVNLSEEQIARALDERLIEIEKDRYVKEYQMAPAAAYSITDITAEVQMEEEKFNIRNCFDQAMMELAGDYAVSSEDAVIIKESFKKFLDKGIKGNK